MTDLIATPARQFYSPPSPPRCCIVIKTIQLIHARFHERTNERTKLNFRFRKKEGVRFHCRLFSSSFFIVWNVSPPPQSLRTRWTLIKSHAERTPHSRYISGRTDGRADEKRKKIDSVMNTVNIWSREKCILCELCVAARRTSPAAQPCAATAEAKKCVSLSTCSPVLS